MSENKNEQTKKQGWFVPSPAVQMHEERRQIFIKMRALQKNSEGTLTDEEANQLKVLKQRAADLTEKMDQYDKRVSSKENSVMLEAGLGVAAIVGGGLLIDSMGSPAIGIAMIVVGVGLLLDAFKDQSKVNDEKRDFQAKLDQGTQLKAFT